MADGMAGPDRPAEVIALAHRHGLRVVPERMTFVETGLDFRVALVDDIDGDAWVLRMPRRASVMQHTAREQRVLRMMSSRLPFAVPNWKILSDQLIAYPALPGTLAVTIDARTHKPVWTIERTSVAYRRSFAAALAALHRIDLDAAARAGLKPVTEDGLRRITFEQMLRVQQELGVGDALWQRWQAWLDDDDMWPTHATLIHGDLHVAHTMVDASARVTGIIDWSEVRIGDPALDFMPYQLGFGDAGLDELIGDYADCGGRTWPRMAEHITERLAAYPVQYALFALESGDAAHIAAVRERLR